MSKQSQIDFVAQGKISGRIRTTKTLSPLKLIIDIDRISYKFFSLCFFKFGKTYIKSNLCS